MKSGSKSTSLKLKKRWFVLTHNSLDYYKSSERNASKLGTLVLNSLCSVVQPDEKVFKDTGQFVVNKRLRLFLRSSVILVWPGIFPLRLLEHNSPRSKALVSSLHQDAEWSHEVDQCHTGGDRQQGSHWNANTAAHPGHQGVESFLTLCLGLLSVLTVCRSQMFNNTITGILSAMQTSGRDRHCSKVRYTTRVLWSYQLPQNICPFFLLFSRLLQYLMTLFVF